MPKHTYFIIYFKQQTQIATYSKDAHARHAIKKRNC